MMNVRQNHIAPNFPRLVNVAWTFYLTIDTCSDAVAGVGYLLNSNDKTVRHAAAQVCLPDVVKQA